MIDYKDIGFKCGLEIHQQIEGKKLFCSCPTLNSKAQPDINFTRKLKAVAGETGAIDIAAQHEMKTSKEFIYEADSKDCCLVDMDEEPPHNINKEAVQISLQVAKMLNADIVDEIQVMRKTVVDGSNVSGFQRTALIAFDGYIETSKGKVSIPSICLEEEAAQKVQTKDNIVKYRIDRLGIPLIEIATGPDIRSPEHAKETAEKLGMILRSTKMCKRGIGTIRQDVNISIKGSQRTEIKGFQDLRSIPTVIENEIKRQQDLLKEDKPIKKQVRKAEPDGTTTFLRPMPGSARLYPETDVMPFKVDKKDIKTSELIQDKAKRFEDLNINKDLAKVLAKSDKADMFDRLVKSFENIKPSFIAETIISTIRELRRKYDLDTSNITQEHFETIFKALDKGDINKSKIPEILTDMIKNKFKDISDYKIKEVRDLTQQIKDIIKEKPGLNPKAYMGIIMKKFKGNVDGKKAMQTLKDILG